MGALRRWKGRAHTARGIGLVLTTQPRRAGDVARWAHDRSKTTLEARLPWWPYPVIDEVQRRLPADARVFEFGGGGSTLWLHDLGARVTCVEHHSGWYESLRTALPDDVELVLREPASTGEISSTVEPAHYFDDYVGEIADRPDESFDLVIVDGRARVACGLAAMTKLKRGGTLLLDDSHRPRYQPLAEALSSWGRTDFVGLKVGGGGTYQSSLWRRPSDH